MLQSRRSFGVDCGQGWGQISICICVFVFESSVFVFDFSKKACICINLYLITFSVQKIILNTISAYILKYNVSLSSHLIFGTYGI